MVANTKVPFAVIVSLSVTLSARTSPLPASPLTVTLIVKGPPEPEPDPEPFGSPAQAISRMESAIKYMRKNGLRAAFINVFFSLGFSPLKARTESEARSPHPAARKWIARGPELVSRRFEHGVTAPAMAPRSLVSCEIRIRREFLANQFTFTTAVRTRTIFVYDNSNKDCFALLTWEIPGEATSKMGQFRDDSKCVQIRGRAKRSAHCRSMNDGRAKPLILQRVWLMRGGCGAAVGDPAVEPREVRLF